MVEPNGPAAALSSSTWIHWWSSVASAKASIRSWVIVVHSPTPMDGPDHGPQVVDGHVPSGQVAARPRRYRSEGGTFSGGRAAPITRSGAHTVIPSLILSYSLRLSDWLHNR